MKHRMDEDLDLEKEVLTCEIYKKKKRVYYVWGRAGWGAGLVR